MSKWWQNFWTGLSVWPTTRKRVVRKTCLKSWFHMMISAARECFFTLSMWKTEPQANYGFPQFTSSKQRFNGPTETSSSGVSVLSNWKCHSGQGEIHSSHSRRYDCSTLVWKTENGCYFASVCFQKERVQPFILTLQNGGKPHQMCVLIWSSHVRHYGSQTILWSVIPNPKETAVVNLMRHVHQILHADARSVISHNPYTATWACDHSSCLSAGSSERSSFTPPHGCGSKSGYGGTFLTNWLSLYGGWMEKQVYNGTGTERSDQVDYIWSCQNHKPHSVIYIYKYWNNLICLRKSCGCAFLRKKVLLNLRFNKMHDNIDCELVCFIYKHNVLPRVEPCNTRPGPEAVKLPSPISFTSPFPKRSCMS